MFYNVFKKYIKNTAELRKTQRYSIYNHIKLFFLYESQWKCLIVSVNQLIH